MCVCVCACVCVCVCVWQDVWERMHLSMSEYAWECPRMMCMDVYVSAANLSNVWECVIKCMHPRRCDVKARVRACVPLEYLCR